MARLWKQWPALALMAFGFGGVAQAQQSREPPVITVPVDMLPVQELPTITVPSNFATQSHPKGQTASSDILTTLPLHAAAPIAPAEPPPVPAKLGKVVIIEDGAVTPASSCPGCAAKQAQAASAPLLPMNGSAGCSDCNGGQDGRGLPHPTKNLVIRPVYNYIVKPVHHFLLMDCWGNHDEYGCGSFQSEFHFAFGSCRTYFGETCGPKVPVPVPPGYPLVPPGPRGGPSYPVPPPALPVQLTPGTKN